MASQELRKFEAKRMCDMILSLARSRSSDMKSWKDGDEEDSSLSKTRDLALPTNWHGMDGSEWTIMRSASLHNPISRFGPSDCPMHSSEFFFPPLLQLTSHYLTFFHALFPLSMQSTISMTFIQKSRQNSEFLTERASGSAFLRRSTWISVYSFCPPAGAERFPRCVKKHLSFIRHFERAVTALIKKGGRTK